MTAIQVVIDDIDINSKSCIIRCGEAIHHVQLPENGDMHSHILMESLKVAYRVDSTLTKQLLITTNSQDIINTFMMSYHKNNASQKSCNEELCERLQDRPDIKIQYIKPVP